MAKEGVALKKVKERAWKERLTMEGAEEGQAVVYECWKEERWLPQGLPQSSFMGQPAVETESTERWHHQATVT